MAAAPRCSSTSPAAGAALELCVPTGLGVSGQNQQQTHHRGQERVKEAPGRPNYPQEQGYKRLQVGAGLGELLSPAWRMRADGAVGLEGRDCCLWGGLEVSLGGRQ